jgi:RNA recognition motif-containing protein
VFYIFPLHQLITNPRLALHCIHLFNKTRPILPDTRVFAHHNFRTAIIMPRGEKVALGDISVPEDRVLRASNLHWDARDAHITRFFDGYGLIDCKRSINVKNGKSTVAYVLLSTLDDVARAIAELDVKRLLGRPVRVMHAEEGFRSKLNTESEGKALSNTIRAVTPSGLLKLVGPEHVGTFYKHYESSALTHGPAIAPSAQSMFLSPVLDIPHAKGPRETPYTFLCRSRFAPPTVLDSEERPSVEMPQPRRSRFQPGPQGPEHRVLLISKLHPDANRNAVELFFQGFRIIDYKRKYNDRLRKYNSTAFVLFESVEERDRAKYTKDGQKILGREVTLDIASKGIRVYNDGFLPNDTIEIVSPPRPLLSHETILGSGFPSNSSPNTQNGPQPETFLFQFARVNNIRHAQKQAQPHTRAGDFDQTYLPMDAIQHVIPETQVPSYDQVPQNPLGIHEEQPVYFHHPFDDAHLRTSRQMVHHRGLGSWNLAGNNSEDKRYNVVTEKEWYGFK